MLGVFGIIIFIFSVVIHEVAHGAMAERMGDPTARLAGRITLNPIRHLDPIGSVMLPILLVITNSPFIIGWAKPVPVNPLNFIDKKYGEAKVSLAGPLANITVAIVFGLLLRFIPLASTSFTQNIASIFGYIVWINLLLAVFNLIPIPPLDGSHILFTFLPRSADNIKIFLSRYGFFLLIFFIFFLFPFIVPVIIFFFKAIIGPKAILILSLFM